VSNINYDTKVYKIVAKLMVTSFKYCILMITGDTILRVSNMLKHITIYNGRTKYSIVLFSFKKVFSKYYELGHLPWKVGLYVYREGRVHSLAAQVSSIDFGVPLNLVLLLCIIHCF
jgi:hypothetical protein